jgi:mannose-1-phosphate guanylyltransferase/mannose-1-phosphate guanylyltransferase/mannose-6-phosphate isomerase
MKDVLSEYQKEQRPWGYFERFTKNEKSTVKILSLNPDQEFSLQEHEHRTEFWKIISGDGTVTVGDKSLEANAGDEFLVEPKQLHRAKAGSEGLKILEIAFGEFDEEDIERVEDDYGRV